MACPKSSERPRVDAWRSCYRHRYITARAKRQVQIPQVFDESRLERGLTGQPITPIRTCTI